MVAAAKIVTILLVLALTAFTISTIVLAVQKSYLKNELVETREKINMLEQITTPAIADGSTTTTEAPKPQVSFFDSTFLVIRLQNIIVFSEEYLNETYVC